MNSALDEVLMSLSSTDPTARAFWLDGAGGRTWSSHRSILGVLHEDDPSLTFDARRGVVELHQGGYATVVGTDIFEALESEMAAHDDIPIWVGYFGYASRTDLPARCHQQTGHAPDAVWMGCRTPIVLDEPPAVTPNRAMPRRPTPLAPGIAPPLAAYEDWFERVQQHLRSGNSYELNLTFRASTPSSRHPMAAYLELRNLNPAPYAGLLSHHGSSLLAASPERFATIDEDGWIETRPIKGTTPRGRTAAEDSLMRQQLSRDDRFRAENLMILDLLRNDLSMVCDVGTVSVPKLMEVETYAHVHQLVSTVRGQLRPDVTAVGSLRSLFPPGSMTGAPKRRTMHLISEIETTPRGVYSGAFGWIAGDGTADLGVVIRSAVATTTSEGYHYEVGSGGGVTVWSDAADEYEETLWKLSGVLGAIPEFGR